MVIFRYLRYGTLNTVFYILIGLLVVIHFLPMIRHPHWVFRASDFGRIQLLVLQIVLFLVGLIFVQDKNILFWIGAAILGGIIIQNIWILFPYTAWYRPTKYDVVENHSGDVTILSANVYQFNKEYDRLIRLIQKLSPDIILTLETNQAWEDVLTVIEKNYPHYKKIPLENCYGMHFYTRLKVKDIKAHFFVADDLPSIEARLTTENGHEFTFFGVHPPPPSPTEEPTSKERDGDLMSIAKRIREIDHPVIAVGDFNNVAWARASKLFRKTSGLIDPRIGRGFVPTFPVRYPLLRCPIDLVFHSKEVFIKDLIAQEDIGSDHFPVLCRFFINLQAPGQQNEDNLDDDEEETVNEMIEEGIKKNGNR